MLNLNFFNPKLPTGFIAAFAKPSTSKQSDRLQKMSEEVMQAVPTIVVKQEKCDQECNSGRDGMNREEKLILRDLHEFIGSDSNFDKLNFNSWHEQACWQYFRLIKHNAEWLNQECKTKANWQSIVHLTTTSSVALNHRISVKHDIEIAKTMMTIGYEDKMVASASSDESNLTNAIEKCAKQIVEGWLQF